MDIVVFSDNKNAVSPFEKLKKSKTWSLRVCSCDEFRKVAPGLAPGSLVYYDITGRTAAEIAKTLKALAGLSRVPYGLIDTKGTTDDIAALFHQGAADYIGKNLIKESLNEKRLDRVIAFCAPGAAAQPCAAPEAEAEKNAKAKPKKEAEAKPEPKKGAAKTPATGNFILSGEDWSAVRNGKEYTFCMMFIELDNQSEIRGKFGSQKTDQLTKRFHDYIQGETESINGKIWMWMDYGGLLLFPFDGKGIESILTACRLMLDSNIISVESMGVDVMLTYRIAMHLGNTLYRERGDTGNIISDSINSVFHLGQKYAEPGNFYLTETIAPFVPRGLDRCFEPAGEYEGRRIIKMTMPRR